MKKGSLSLSINAIVILVLAITMLGLGLAFTKGMFSKFSSKLEVPPPNIPATAEEPIILPDESVEVLKNKDFEMTVNFYNDGTTGEIFPSIECSGPPLQTYVCTPTFDQSTGTYGEPGACLAQAAPQNVNSGSYKPFKFIVGAVKETGRAICTLRFYNLMGTPDVTDDIVVDKQITILAK